MNANPPAFDVAHILAGEGVGALAATSGWRIGVGQEPESVSGQVPHTCITLYDLPGTRLYSTRIEEPVVQVRVRGSPGDYPGAYSKAQEVAQALFSVDGRLTGGWTYSTVRLEGDIGHLGYDEANRPLFVATYKLMRSDLE